VVGAAERVAYAPLRAEALLLHGELLDRSGDAAEAEQALRAAAAAAAEAGDDERLAGAWASLVYVLGMMQARHQEALQLADVAETIATRARSARVSGMLANHQGAVLHAIGRYPEAESRFRRALALRESALGKEHPDVASSLGNLGSALASQGKLDDAQQLQERALALRVVAFGHEHPIVAGSLTSLARLASLRGDEGEAARREQRALAIRERTLGAHHTDAGVSLSNLGGYAAAQDDHTAAVAFYRRALTVFGAALPPDHPYISRALTGLGESLVHIGRPAEALPLLETALAIKQKLEDPVELAHAEFALATAVHAARRDRPRARDLMLRARDNYARAGPRAAEWHRMATDWLAAHR
jgi:serine/threonine-protein kinase